MVVFTDIIKSDVIFENKGKTFLCLFLRLFKYLVSTVNGDRISCFNKLGVVCNLFRKEFCFKLFEKSEFHSRTV